MTTSVNYFQGLQRLRSSVREPVPKHEILKSIGDLLLDSDIQREFFQILDDAEWIKPLKESRFFETPSDKSYWPQSRFLARMAAKSPRDVVEVLIGIDANNWYVARDIIDAAKAMPPEFSVRLVPKIVALVSQFSLAFELSDVGEIIAHLAKGNQVDAAFDLFRNSFSPQENTDAINDRRREHYVYFKSLRELIIPSLVPSKSKELLELLLEWLKQALSSERASKHRGDNYSYFWRAAIEEHGQNSDSDHTSLLVDCVRDAFELAIRDHHLPLTESIQMLDAQSLQLFRRLRIHLIGEFADRDVDLARRTMFEHSLFADMRVKHEYARLMEKRYPLLEDSEKVKWLSWIDAGPEALEPDFFEESDDDETKKAGRDYWKFSRLHWIREHLTGDRKEFYDRMLAQCGWPHLSDVHSYVSSGYVSHTSPYTVEQFTAMGFEAALASASCWRADAKEGGLSRRSVEGLADAFGAYISANLLEFSSMASLLKERPAILARRFLEVFRDAAKERKQYDVTAILDLCGWVIARPAEESQPLSSEDGALVDRDWKWCLSVIAELAQNICEARSDDKRPAYEIGLRKTIWGLLLSLLDAPGESTVDDNENQKDPRVANWPFRVINSLRGKAMQGVFAYSEWLVDHDVKNRDYKVAYPGGFSKMEEVSDLLEAQLKRRDPSFAERAAIGWRLGLLIWLDQSWVDRQANRLFDLRVLEKDSTNVLGWAAWNSFLFGNTPHVAFYNLLREQFSYAVDQAAVVESPDREDENPFHLLGEHLIVLFARGDLGKDPEEGYRADNELIRRLVTRTKLAIRSRAMYFVGKICNEQKDDIPKPVADRFRYLWEQYWKETGKADAGETPNSLVFGYWFTSGVFDSQWSIERLEEFVSAAPKAELDNQIVEKLVEIAHVDPLRSAKIIGIMADADVENWRISSWQDDAKKILSVALAVGGEPKDTAERIIDRLGRRGYLEFGELVGATA